MNADILSTFTGFSASDKIWGMGKAGKALKQVLETHGISQNQLAVTMRVDRSNVHRWVHEQRDPAGDVIVEIKNALKQLNPDAAEDFVKLYLGDWDTRWGDQFLERWGESAIAIHISINFINPALNRAELIGLIG